MDKGTLQERNHASLTRRRFSIGMILGLATGIAGCGGSGEDAAPSPVSTGAPPSRDTSPGSPSTPTTPSSGTSATGSPPSWNVTPEERLTLTAGGSFDLARTLPATVPAGGVFDLDPAGAPLPAGVSLHPNGLLTVGSSADGSTSGVVFRYTPPA